MILKCCAWHSKYFGRGRFLGVARWWPLWGVDWTHGMCNACRTRFADEWKAKNFT